MTNFLGTSIPTSYDTVSLPAVDGRESQGWKRNSKSQTKTSM